MRVQQELLVCTEVKESAGGIIRASGKGISTREELERKKKGGHKNHGGGAPGMAGVVRLSYTRTHSYKEHGGWAPVVGGEVWHA